MTLAARSDTNHSGAKQGEACASPCAFFPNVVQPTRMSASSTQPQPLSLGQVAQRWWPLAASWLLMSAELPALSAIVARLPDPEIHLAAYGGVVMSLALIIESPILMLLAASTALSRDWASFVRLRRFMLVLSGALTLVHAAVAFTPLYDLVVVGLMQPPTEVVEPARLGLMIMTPFTFGVAYRRFHQGVLIRFGHSRAVGLGTVLRLSSTASVLAIGYLAGTLPGIVVATSAVIAGIVAEAVYAHVRAQPVLRYEVRLAPPVKPALFVRAILAFYVPLAMTSTLYLIIRPLGSAAISRMPDALNSLAVYAVVQGLVFMVQALGIALNEVVVATLDTPRAAPVLRCFTLILSACTTGLLLVMVLTPLSSVWFEQIAGLSPELASRAHTGLWLALPLPAISAFQSWFQGTIVHSRRTRGITEATMIYLACMSAMLIVGMAWGQVAGLYVALGASTFSVTAQLGWLWRRSQSALQATAGRAPATQT